MINKLYRKEHSHKDDKNWTAGDNLKWRQEYAPPILKDIKENLTRFSRCRTKTCHRRATFIRQYIIWTASGML